MARMQDWATHGPPDAEERLYRRPDDQARAGAPARALRRASEGDEVGDWMARRIVEGGVTTTMQIIFALGWKPAPTQQAPLPRGSRPRGFAQRGGEDEEEEDE